MAKGAHLTGEVKSLITEIYSANPDLGPTAIRKKLLRRMKERGLDRNFGSNWPNVGAVGKVITKIRPKIGLDPEDRPWSLWDVMEPSIPGDALPTVLMLWADQLDYGQPITIREAKWIAKLYYIFKDRGRDDMSFLLEIAKDYAIHERGAKMLEEYPSKLEDMWFRWWIDALFYYPLFKDKRPLNIIQSGKLPKVLTVEEMEIEAKKEAQNERSHTSKG